MPKTCRKNIAGMRFGRLVATGFVPDEGRHARFMFDCDCGSTGISIMSQSVLRGATLSCGCLHREISSALKIKHGENMGKKGRSITYGSWAAMMTRSHWGKHPSYRLYGEKGIKVCDRWLSFENFRDDMGERPPGTSIDRIDNKLGYFPGNCRWATIRQQALNKEKTVRIVFGEEVMSAMDLCERVGFSINALRSRARRRGGDYVSAFMSIGVCAKAVGDNARA